MAKNLSNEILLALKRKTATRMRQMNDIVSSIPRLYNYVRVYICAVDVECANSVQYYINESESISGTLLR